MTKPATQQIKQVADEMAASLGNAVNLQGGELALRIDSQFPGMTDDEFGAVRAECIAVADAMRGAAMQAMWGEAA